MVPPPQLRAELLAARHASDLAGPTLPQAALVTLLADGSYERHLRSSRRHQRRRRDALVAAVIADSVRGR